MSVHALFFNLLLILLPTQLGYHTWPAWAMVLGRRVDYLSPTIYLTDILIFLLIIFAYKKIIFNIKLRYVLLFLFFVGIHLYFSVNRLITVYVVIKLVEFLFLGLYIFQEKPKLQTTIFYLSIGVFYSSIIAIVQFILQRSIGGPLWFLGERTFTVSTPGIAVFEWITKLRPYATFPHPNVLGGYLAVLLPAIIYQFTNIPNDKIKKIFYIATIILGSLTLLLTFSRTAIIAFVLGLLLIYFRKNKTIFISLLVGFCVLLFFIINTIGFQDESVVVRQKLNQSAVAMIMVYPVTGVGLGNFLVELPNYITSREIYFLQPVHNIYLLLFSEIGIIGFGGIVLAIYLFFRNHIVNLQNSVSISMIVTILFLGLFDHYPLSVQQGQLLFTIVLTTMATWRK